MSMFKYHFFSVMLVAIIAICGLSYLIVETFESITFSDLMNATYYVVPIPFYLLIGTLILALLVASLLSGTFYMKRRKIYLGLERILNNQPLYKNERERSKWNDLSFEWMEKLEAEKQDRMKRIRYLASELASIETDPIHEDQILEKERSRLARELHDSVSQQLFGASMLLSSITEQNAAGNEALDQQLNKVEEMIQQAQLEMRALLLQLRPIALRDKSLKDGVESFLSDLRQRVPINLKWKLENVSMDKDIEDQLFRILQECVSNSLRHAKAGAINILLIERDEYVILRMVDDGIGFDIEEAEKSYGLINIKERAYEIGGQARVVSLEEYGTKIEIKVPARGVGLDD
ncbi:sensor histidine kinase [Halalkalibacillus halophilus]|uniref:sensor histidine kinase n=1 Tax=Halalkalibacillus halophilus TaxID=392827 RepID=UPI000404B4F5|nr:sensor histidine kinase [Halalkalibacillus halophilus]